MIPKRIDAISGDDLRTIVSEGVKEGRTLEFKESLPGRGDSDRKEFLADIASFANTSGGDIVYGMSGERDADGKTTGAASEFTGLKGISTDAETLRLKEMVLHGVAPRIVGLDVVEIEGGDEGPAILVRIPDSFQKPHMVTFKGSSRFHGRTSAGKHQLDVGEIRTAFVQSAKLPEMLRAFVLDRLTKLLDDAASISLIDGPIVAVHFVPISAMLDSHKIDPRDIEHPQSLNFAPFGKDGLERINLDGYAKYTATNEADRARIYGQLFRNGAVEFVSSSVHVKKNGESSNFSATHLCNDLLTTLIKLRNLYHHLDVDPPYVIFVSLLNIAPCQIYLPERFRHFIDTVTIKTNQITFSEQLIDEPIPDDRSLLANILRPLFDEMWQAFGIKQCMDFTQEGEWPS